MESDVFGNGQTPVHMDSNDSASSSAVKPVQSALKPYVVLSGGTRCRSPHFSPDRITRHASPGRRDLAEVEINIVPRIPQPYRTSFSAVTSPLRVPKPVASDTMIPAESTPINLLGVQRRTTSPGRIKPMCSRPSADNTRKQFCNKPFNNHVEDAAASDEVKFSRTEHSKVENADTVHNCSHHNLSYDSANEVSPLLPQNQPEACHSYESTQNHPVEVKPLDSFDDINSTADLNEIPDSRADIKHMVVKNDRYLNPVEKDTRVQQTEHPMLTGKFKSPKTDSKLLLCKNDISTNKKNNSEKKFLKVNQCLQGLDDGQERSKTLPSQVISVDSCTDFDKNPKPISTSIANFFRKMSPKSLRRYTFSVEKTAQGSHDTQASADSLLEDGQTRSHSLSQSDSSGTPADVGNIINVDDNKIYVSPTITLTNVASENARRSRSFRKSPTVSSVKRLFSRSKSKDGSTTSTEKHSLDRSEIGKIEGLTPAISSGKEEECCTDQLMTQEMTLILKSIEVNSSKVQKKSVYQAFKEKRSPNKTSESALGLKPQTLHAVEIPDNLLQSESCDVGIPVSSPVLSSSLPGLLDRGHPTFSFDNVESVNDSEDVEKPVPETAQRRCNPPSTLNVHPVHHINKQCFMFPSMSVESIGQCSLDVAHAGSEASLVHNSHFSSTSASKRTLTSQENIAEPSAKPVPPVNGSNSSVVKVDDVVCDASDFSDVQSRSPSYLKLSRAIGGYTPYNTYVSVAEHNRTRTEQNASRNRTVSDIERKETEVILHNGDAFVAVKHGLQNYGSVAHGPQVNVDLLAGVPTTGNVFVNDNKSLLTFVDGSECEALPSSALPASEPAATAAAVNVPFVNLPSQVTSDGCHASTLSNDKGVVSTDGALQILQHQKDPSGDQDDSTLSQLKDGWFFLKLVDDAELLLKQQCDKTEIDLQANMSDEVEGKMRAAVGKANLLIKKKFPQFRQLCRSSLDQNNDEPFKTTAQDLSGFWDMVQIQVDDVNRHFEEIETLRQSGWKEPNVSEKFEQFSAPSTKPAGTKLKTPKPRSVTSTKSPMSSPAAVAAAKAREEARQRLLAAKAAGRQRKASESDKDIEIFVS